MRFICPWLMICAVEQYQKMNYHICLIIYWILRAMKKYWNCIKWYAENIYMFIRVALNSILKHIGEGESKEVKDFK